MPETVLQLDPRDNVLVALAPLAAGSNRALRSHILGPHLHRYRELSRPNTSSRSSTSSPANLVLMYGMVVGEATAAIARGGLALHAQRPSSHRWLHSAKGSRFVRTARRFGMDVDGPSMATTEPTAR